MARRRRFTSAESRLIRRLAAEGKSQREAIRAFRSGGLRKIGDALFRGVYKAIQQSLDKGVKLANLNRQVIRGDGIEVRIPRLKTIIDTAAAVQITAKGYAAGTAVASLGGRTYDVPYNTPLRVIKLRLSGLEKVAQDRAVRRALLVATGNSLYPAALKALRDADANFAEAAASYGRIEVRKNAEPIITELTATPIK